MADKYLIKKVPNPCHKETKGILGYFGDFMASLKKFVIVNCECCTVTRVFFILIFGIMIGAFVSHLSYGIMAYVFVRSIIITSVVGGFIACVGTALMYLYDKED